MSVDTMSVRWVGRPPVESGWPDWPPPYDHKSILSQVPEFGCPAPDSRSPTQPNRTRFPDSCPELGRLSSVFSGAFPAGESGPLRNLTGFSVLLDLLLLVQPEGTYFGLRLRFDQFIHNTFLYYKCTIYI